MSFRRQQVIGWLVLASFAVAGVAWLLRADLGQKISTDVLELIPPAERSPEMSLVRELASQAEGRTMLLVVRGAASDKATRAAAEKFAEGLRRHAAFREVVVLANTEWRDRFGKALFDERFALLFPGWLEAHTRSGGGAEPAALAAAAASELEAFLTQPEALAAQDAIGADPLLLLPHALLRLQDQGAELAQTGARPGLIWAQISASPLSEAGQKPVFAAIADEGATLRKEFPEARVVYTGVNCFAAESRARIEREVSLLNSLSLVAVLGVAVTFIRQVFRAIHLVPAILLSVLGAWVAVTLAFERVHVIVFVIGSLLTGVAIDYGFYLFMQPPRDAAETYWEKARRLLKPLLASCLTTVAGFGLLLFSDLPMIRQIGVFVGVGLVCALGAALIYFSTVKNPFLLAREKMSAPVASAGWRRRLRWALAALWLAALPGLFFLRWRDDIRQLSLPTTRAEETDREVRSEFGGGSGRNLYLTYGKNLAEARRHLQAFEAWQRENAPAAKAANLGLLVPTPEGMTAAAKFASAHPEFAGEVLEALEKKGFEREAFGRFEAAWRDYRAESETEGASVEAVWATLEKEISGPLGLLVHRGESLAWFVTMEQQLLPPPPAELQTLGVNQLETLNRLFARYRLSALKLSAVGLGLVGIGVLLTYGWRDGVRIFAIPCGACVGVFGVFGWLGYPLNLFHLLGAFLGVCLTHNYSIFSATQAFEGRGVPVSVRVSALTTAASFGVLAISGIPVVRALGLTVMPMVVMALLVIEFEHLAALGKKP